MERRDHENSSLAFLTEQTTISPRVDLRERIKIEFYKTYDVMTGIRIAATLGGFFSMMILLVLYKNYCKPNKTLSEEQLNAAVTAAAEEEDRALQAALEATSFYTSLGNPRRSLVNTSQVLLSPRFSSVGGGYSHLTPPLRITDQRGKSLPGSVMRFGSNSSPLPLQRNGKSECPSKEGFDLETRASDCCPTIACKNLHLNVPPSRRVSSVTCSSADSSYLERRCSAFEMGLPGPPHFVRQSREKLLGKKEEPWDFYYPIDIQVIQPTPEMSPTASERNLYDDHAACGLQVPGTHDQMHRLSVTSFEIGLAPLASISSLGSFSSQSSSLLSKSLNATNNNNPVENSACTCVDDSLGSDSVFMDDMDIEDDVDELATDSEFEYDGFDDDYSFCESKQKAVEMRSLQFASFDSYDASITQDSISESAEEETFKATNQPEEKQALCKQYSSDLKRHPSLHEGSKVKRKLVKTSSEPRSSKILKQLPPWTERGRSGYIPKRQLSSPSEKKRHVLEVAGGSESPPKSAERESKTDVKPPEPSNPQEDTNAKDFLLPPSSNSSSSDSATLTPTTRRSDTTVTSVPIQGFKTDLPFKTTYQLPNTQEKRSRLQKQKNFIEEGRTTNQNKEKTECQRLTGTEESIIFPTGPATLLKPPNTSLTGSCERLANHKACEELGQEVPDVHIRINLSSCEGEELPTRTDYSFPSSSQDITSK